MIGPGSPCGRAKISHATAYSGRIDRTRFVSISMQSARLHAHAAGRSLLDRNGGDAKLAEGPGVGHEVSGRTWNREFGGAGSDRKRQQQLVSKMELDGSRRCVMLAQCADCLVGNSFGRPSQPAIGGKAHL